MYKQMSMQLRALETGFDLRLDTVKAVERAREPSEEKLAMNILSILNC